MESKVAFFVACLSGVVCFNTTDKPANQDPCISSIFGAEYRGTQDRTDTGKPCMRWDIVLPSSTTNWTAHENYCRYFADEHIASFRPAVTRRQPWCFTDGDGGWQPCNIERCDLPPYDTCYETPDIPISTNLTTECNCSVSLSLKANPPVKLISAIFLYPLEGDTCAREVVLNLDGKALELTCQDGQSIDLSMQMTTTNVSYKIGLGIKVVDDEDNTTMEGLHRIKYTTMPYVTLTECKMIFPIHERQSSGTSNVEIRPLDGNSTEGPVHQHDRVLKGHHSNHTLKGLVIGLVVSAVVAVGVITVITYIWLIDKRHMRSELLREYLGDDHLSSDEEKTYFSEPKAYINAIAIESERDEQAGPRTLDQLDPAALARNNKPLRPNGCKLDNVDPQSKDKQNGHATKIETAIVPINELENFDDLSDVIANPMARGLMMDNSDQVIGRSADQENTV